MSRFTRTTPPASAAQLRANAATLTAEIASLEAEGLDCNAALCDLVGDPAYPEVESRARELRFLIPSKRDVLARIEAAIPAAEERERQQHFAERKADLERQTSKLARAAERRWTEAAAALAAIAEELRANERACDMLSRAAHEIGEEGVRCAEYRMRGDLPRARLLGVYRSVIGETRIPNWQGGPPLFDGDPRPRP